MLAIGASTPGGAPDKVHLALDGSGSSSSGTTGTVEYNNTHLGVRTPVSFPRYGPVLLTTGAIGVLHRFLVHPIQTPKDAFDPTILVFESLYGDGFVLWKK